MSRADGPVAGSGSALNVGCFGFCSSVVDFSGAPSGDGERDSGTEGLGASSSKPSPMTGAVRFESVLFRPRFSVLCFVDLVEMLDGILSRRSQSLLGCFRFADAAADFSALLEF